MQTKKQRLEWQRVINFSNLFCAPSSSDSAGITLELSSYMNQQISPISCTHFMFKLISVEFLHLASERALTDNIPSSHQAT